MSIRICCGDDQSLSWEGYVPCFDQAPLSHNSPWSRSASFSSNEQLARPCPLAGSSTLIWVRQNLHRSTGWIIGLPWTTGLLRATMPNYAQFPISPICEFQRRNPAEPSCHSWIILFHSLYLLRNHSEGLGSDACRTESGGIVQSSPTEQSRE